MNKPLEHLKTQLSHRTIREFKPEALDANIIDALTQVAQRTATSNGLQASSILRITDPELKKAISEICNQPYVGRAPELWIFIVDQARNAHIAHEKGVEEVNAYEMNRFISGFTDACLTAQNVVNALETLGLGSVYLGSVHNDIPKLCSLLKLPALTFPVLGLGFGIPNQNPDLKPRMPMEFRLYENTYPAQQEPMEKYLSYDQSMNQYYDLRNMNQRVDTFTDQVAKRYHGHSLRSHWMDLIKNQGFHD